MLDNDVMALLGGAIALLDSIFLSLPLSSNITVRMVSYGMPRVRLSSPSCCEDLSVR